MNANVLSILRVLLALVSAWLVQKGIVPGDQANATTDTLLGIVGGIGALAWGIWTYKKNKAA